MPRINVYLNDNTGAEYTGNEQVIFVPGPIKIRTGQADDNECVYISASDYAKVTDTFLDVIDVTKIASELKNLDEALSKAVEEDAGVIRAVEAEAEAKKAWEDAEEGDKATKKNLYNEAVKAAADAKKTAAEKNNKDLLAYVADVAVRVGLDSTTTEDALKAAIAVDTQGKITGSAKKVVEKEIQCLAIIETYLKNDYDVIYCNINLNPTTGTKPTLKFLWDKDRYNIKFLTAGVDHTIQTTITTTPKSEKTAEETAEETINSNSSISFDFSVLNTLMSIAQTRRDCIVVASVKYDTEKCVEAGITGDVLADCVKMAMMSTSGIVGGAGTTISVSTTSNAELVTTDDIGKFATLIVPNEICKLTTLSKGAVEFTAPASFAYLVALGACMKKNQYWLPVANSARGSVDFLGRPDLTVTKYHMDQSIILDKDVIAFNGIVKIRPYGNVIWGDRTLLKLTNSVKALGYTSLMLMVCDISKEAYDASVRYTYESNNEVTWLSYKSRITALLDQMVTAGVLQSYDVAKIPADTYNKIVCRITIYPNLPVENFDIYINLENAELQLENA